MKLKNIKKEDLEILSYTDLAELILKENKNSLNTPNLFREICTVLEYTEDDFASNIGDFYTSLAIDKRFVFLENNEWDLREKHPVEIVLDDEDLDEEIEEEELEEEIVEEEIEDDLDADSLDDDLDDDFDDDMEDLAVLTEDELEEDN